MSTVVVDIDNQYENELCDGYQLICEDDDTYTIWVSTGVLSGFRAHKKIETFGEAFRLLTELVNEREYFLV
jgi:hypothetical protein